MKGFSNFTLSYLGVSAENSQPWEGHIVPSIIGTLLSQQFSAIEYQKPYECHLVHKEQMYRKKGKAVCHKRLRNKVKDRGEFSGKQCDCASRLKTIITSLLQCYIFNYLSNRINVGNQHKQLFIQFHMQSWPFLNLIGLTLIASLQDPLQWCH